MDGEAEERVAEAAGVLSRYCDLIGVRAFPKFVDWQEDRKDKILNAFAKYATVPVVNMETIWNVAYRPESIKLYVLPFHRISATVPQKNRVSSTYHLNSVLSFMMRQFPIMA